MSVFGIDEGMMMSFDEWVFMCQSYVDRNVDAKLRIVKHLENSI